MCRLDGRGLLAFHLERRSIKILFDELQRTMAEDRLRDAKVLVMYQPDL
jgi:hypothetical protein